MKAAERLNRGYTHRMVHGIGVEVHEPLYISASSKLVFDENMVSLLKTAFTRKT